MTILEGLLVNLTSSYLENLFHRKVTERDRLESKLRQVLEEHDNVQQSVDEFVNFFAKAVQQSSIDANYTDTLAKLIQQLSDEGVFEQMLKQAFVRDELFEQVQINAIKRIELDIESGTYPILFFSVEEFVEKLQKMMDVFVSSTQFEAKLLAEIKKGLERPLIPLAKQKSRYNQQRVESFLKLHYRREFAAFQPHQQLNSQINDFLAFDGDDMTQPDIKIQILYGPGGIGKSRIAFHLCNTQSESWHCGFLSNSQVVSCENYRWDRPALLVIDYAGQRTSQTQELLTSLLDQDALIYPVRILLLERQWSEDVEWFQNLKLNSRFGHMLMSKPIRIPYLKETQKIALAESYLREVRSTNSVALSRKVVEKADELELGKARPLIIQLVAELINDDASLACMDNEELIESFFKREDKVLESLWHPLTFKNILVDEIWSLLTLVTLAGGCSQEEIAKVVSSDLITESARSNLKKVANYDVYIVVHRLLGIPPCKKQRWPSVEPDLLGEYLILRNWRRWLQKIRFNIDEDDHIYCQLNTAFAISSHSADTLIRICGNFTFNNPLLEEDRLKLYTERFRVGHFSESWEKFVGHCYINASYDNPGEATVNLISLFALYKLNSSLVLALSISALLILVTAHSNKKRFREVNALRSKFNAIAK